MYRCNKSRIIISTITYSVTRFRKPVPNSTPWKAWYSDDRERAQIVSGGKGRKIDRLSRWKSWLGVVVQHLQLVEPVHWHSKNMGKLLRPKYPSLRNISSLLYFCTHLSGLFTNTANLNQSIWFPIHISNCDTVSSCSVITQVKHITHMTLTRSQWIWILP